MATLDLRKLWALHQVDYSMLRIQSEYRRLEDFTQENERLQELEEQNKPLGGRARELKKEMSVLEGQDADLSEKLKRADAALYGGKASSSREIEGYEREIAGFKASKSKIEDRMLEILDELPDLESKSAPLEEEIAAIQKAVAAKKETAVKEQATLKKDLQKLAVQRPIQAKEVPPPLLAKYEAIRQKRHGIGMVLITATHNCGVCGMKVADKAVEQAQAGTVVTCEGCGRILYWTDGVS